MSNSNSYSSKLVIAMPLSIAPVSLAQLPSLQKTIRHYIGESASYIITHCKNDACKTGLCCIDFHPQNVSEYIRYLLRASALVIKVLMKNSRIVSKRKCALVLWGTIFVPLQFIFRPICRVYLVNLGEWRNVTYWKIYYRYGEKTAKLMKTIAYIVDKISFLMSDKLITNTYSVALEASSLQPNMKYKIQPINIKCKKYIKYVQDYIPIVYIGRLDYEKGITTFLKMCLKIVNDKKIRNKIRCIIAGTGPLEYFVRHVARKLGKNIVYMGYLDYDRLVDLYKKSSILIIPSHTEGLPSVLLEAILCSVPYIIVSESIKKNIEIVVNKIKSIIKSKIIYFNNENDLINIINNIVWRQC